MTKYGPTDYAQPRKVALYIIMSCVLLLKTCNTRIATDLQITNTCFGCRTGIQKLQPICKSQIHVLVAELEFCQFFPNPLDLTLIGTE